MDTVLGAAKTETKELKDESKSSQTSDISYEPQAFTREGRSD